MNFGDETRAFRKLTLNGVLLVEASLAHEIEDHPAAAQDQWPESSGDEEQAITRSQNGLFRRLAIGDFDGFRIGGSLHEPNDTSCYKKARQFWPAVLLVDC